MSALLPFTASFIAGSTLGLVFFLGLWATVRRLQGARHPAFWILASLLVRFGFILAGFLALARLGGWEHLLVAAAGFTLARLIIVRRMQAGPVKAEPRT